MKMTIEIKSLKDTVIKKDELNQNIILNNKIK